MVELRNYAKGLVDCGNDAGRVNAYSKTVLFNATLFNIAKFEDIYKLIKSIKRFDRNCYLYNVVEEYISYERLKALLKKLIGTYQNMIVENEFIKETNAKMKDVCGIAKKVCRTMFFNHRFVSCTCE